jgi:hypothetical protein
MPKKVVLVGREATRSQETTMKKNYTKMNRAELAAATRQFDAANEPRFGKAPLREQRRHDALVRKIKRQRGRPRIGEGSERVQITVEGSLLQQADRFAREKGISRSQLVAEGLLLALRRKSA